MTTTQSSDVSAGVRPSDYEREAVPASERKGWLPISLIWIAIGIDLSGTILGVQLGQGLPFETALGATIVGSVLLGLLAMACTYVGAASGLTTGMISRVVFGRAGGRLIAAMMAISALGWFAVQVGFFASNAHTAISELTGVSVPLVLLNAAGGLLMMLTALWGYRSIQRLSSWAVPLLIIILFAGVGLALAKMGPDNLFSPVDSSFTFGGAVSLVMGIFVLGVVVSPDIARWARTPKQAMAAGFTGFFVGNSLIVVVALVLSRLMQTDDLVGIFFALGIGLAAIIVLTLAQWTTNTSNIYSASLSLSVVFDRVPRRTLTLIGGVVATIVACLGMYDAFIPFIAAMGIVIAPYGGVYLAEFFVVDRARFTFHEGDRIQSVNWQSVAAWLTGCAVAVMTANPADGLGLDWFTMTTISAMDGLIVAFVAQAALGLLNTSRRKAQR